MSLKKKRILILSGVIPAIGRGGGCLALHRHFVERNDFEIAVGGAFLHGVTAENFTRIFVSPILERFQRTRFRRFFVNLQILISWIWLPRKVALLIRGFRPDCIFTVPDNLHLGWAWGASRKFGIPLAVNFQDLFPISSFVPQTDRPYRWLSNFLMWRFRVAARKSEVVFYTSEGMQDFFKSKKRGYVLYPVGAKIEIQEGQLQDATNVTKLIYAGNCYGAYGRMLLSLARELAKSSQVQFKIFTAGNDWSEEDREYFEKSGVLNGFKPFDELKSEFASADAFLTVMSFEEGERRFVETSFTTKWLDYAPFCKPVIVWGPDYSSAAIFARMHSCGAVIGSPRPDKAKREIERILNDEQYCLNLSKNSRTVAVDVLNARKIHEILKSGLLASRSKHPMVSKPR
jgi:hypothetical protein